MNKLILLNDKRREKVLAKASSFAGFFKGERLHYTAAAIWILLAAGAAALEFHSVNCFTITVSLGWAMLSMLAIAKRQ